jgi:hypothetical protein
MKMYGKVYSALLSKNYQNFALPLPTREDFPLRGIDSIVKKRLPESPGAEKEVLPIEQLLAIPPLLISPPRNHSDYRHQSHPDHFRLPHQVNIAIAVAIIV